jgi:hypothetical protein
MVHSWAIRTPILIKFRAEGMSEVVEENVTRQHEGNILAISIVYILTRIMNFTISGWCNVIQIRDNGYDFDDYYQQGRSSEMKGLAFRPLPAPASLPLLLGPLPCRPRPVLEPVPSRPLDPPAWLKRAPTANPGNGGQRRSGLPL